MNTNAMQLTKAGGLLLLGVVLGLQMSKAPVDSSSTLSLIQESHASTPISVAATEYFPSGYVNQARFVEPLPAQF